jgi:competence protein ComEC
MIALYLLARILDRDHSPLNAIGGVALILLYLRPAWLFESGFQLSFAAALLIVGVAVPVLERSIEPYRRALRRLDDVLLDDYFSPRIAQSRLDLRALIYAMRRRVGFLDRYPALSRHIVVAPLKVLVWVANILIFSAVLQLGLLLPMVETFHRVTFAGVGLNALAIPVMTVLLALALPINLLSVVSAAVAAWPAKVLSLVMALLFDMTHLPALATWLSYRIPAPPLWVAWEFCAAFVVAGLTLCYARRGAGVVLAVCAVFVVMVAVHPFAPRLPHGALQLTALDCGQGDALFLVLPDGTTMLVDAGGSRTRGAREGGFQGRRWDSGEDIVSPYLWSLGLKKIDVVVLTHARPDQLGGLYAVLANFRVGEFWHAPESETPEFAALLDTVAEREIPTRTLMAGDTLSFGDASVRVLWPAPDCDYVAPSFSPASARAGLKTGSASVSHRDDNSLVLRISAGGMNFLLPGDVNSNAEKRILASGEPLESQVLQMGHRKSSTSREFLARVVPQVAIVSPAAGGKGDSPNPEMMGALETGGARIFRTDTEGATSVEWKQGLLVVRTSRHSQGIVIRGESSASLRR